MFHIQPGWFWERRRLDPRLEQRLRAHNPRTERLAGPLPGLAELLRLPTATRITWSVELGARFRDALRAAAGRRHLAARRDRRRVRRTGGQGLPRAHARRAARADLRPACARRRAAAGPRLVGEDGARAAVAADHARAGGVLADAEPRLRRPDRRGVPGLHGRSARRCPRRRLGPAAARSRRAGAAGARPEVPLRPAARLPARARPGREHAPPLARRGQALAGAVPSGARRGGRGRLRLFRLPLREQSARRRAGVAPGAA